MKNEINSIDEKFIVQISYTSAIKFIFSILD